MKKTMNDNHTGRKPDGTSGPAFLVGEPARRSGRPLQPFGGQRAAGGDGGYDLPRRRVPRDKSLGADLRHDDRLAGAERQLGGGHHRRDADLAAHGADHGCGVVSGYQRFRPAQEVAAQLLADGRRGHRHLDALLLHLAARDGAQRVAGPHRSDDLRRADRLLRRSGGYRGTVAQRSQFDGHSRCGDRHGADAAALHGGFRTGHGAVQVLHRSLLPLFHQHGLHRAGDLHHRPHAEIPQEEVPRSGARTLCQAHHAAHHARDVHPQRRHRAAHGAGVVLRVGCRPLCSAGVPVRAYARNRV